MSLAQRTGPSLSFGPYHSAGNALAHCHAFINAGFQRSDVEDFGIIWMEPGGAAVLRTPCVDLHDEIGPSLLVQWHGPVPPRDVPVPSGISWQSIEDTVRGTYERIALGMNAAGDRLTSVDTALRQNFGPAGQLIEQLTGISTLLEMRAAWQFLEREIAQHPKIEAVAVTAIDALGIVGSIIGCVVLLPEIATIGGALAFFGSLTAGVSSGLLAGVDGVKANYVLRVNDENDENDQMAHAVEASEFYRRTQLLAPLLVLPDAIRSGLSVAHEIAEADELAKLAEEGHSTALAEDNRAISRISEQQASNSSKLKLNAGDRKKLQKLIGAKHETIRRLRRAKKLLAQKQAALHKVILRAAYHDGATLLSAAAGTAAYTVNTPELLELYRNANENHPAGRMADIQNPAHALLPSSAETSLLATPQYFSFSITATSRLKPP